MARRTQEQRQRILELTKTFEVLYPYEAGAKTTGRITLEAFDRFAESQGLYLASAEPEVRNAQRNIWRGHMNDMACSPFWVDFMGPAFHIRVFEFGKSYVRETTDLAYKHKGKGMPELVASLTNNKMVALKRLLDSADFELLPKADRDKLMRYHGRLEGFSESIADQAKSLSRYFRDMQLMLASLVSTKQIEPTNGGIRQILEIDNDSADDEQPNNPG